MTLVRDSSAAEHWTHNPGVGGANPSPASNSESEMKQYIYESPDKGKTIYRREFGKLDRELVSQPKQG